MSLATLIASSNSPAPHSFLPALSLFVSISPRQFCLVVVGRCRLEEFSRAVGSKSVLSRYDCWLSLKPRICLIDRHCCSFWAWFDFQEVEAAAYGTWGR